MGREQLEQTDLYTVEWATSADVPVFTWTQFCSGENFRESLRSWEAVMDDHDVQRYLVNTEAVTAHDDEDKRWLAETWIPDLVEMGVHSGAGVYAGSAIAEMDMGRIEEQMSGIDPNYEFRIFDNESDALDWLAEH